MIHIPINRGMHMRPSHRSPATPILAILARYTAAYAAALLRALILLLVGLLAVLIALVFITARYEVGPPVIGSILLVGGGAAHFAP